MKIHLIENLAPRSMGMYLVSDIFAKEHGAMAGIENSMCTSPGCQRTTVTTANATLKVQPASKVKERGPRIFRSIVIGCSQHRLNVSDVQK